MAGLAPDFQSGDIALRENPKQTLHSPQLPCLKTVRDLTPELSSFKRGDTQMRSTFLVLLTSTLMNCSTAFAFGVTMPLCCQRANSPVVYAAYYRPHMQSFSGPRSYSIDERHNITRYNIERYYAHRPYGHGESFAPGTFSHR
jgi:hypothetical protein